MMQRSTAKSPSRDSARNGVVTFTPFVLTHGVHGCPSFAKPGNWRLDEPSKRSSHLEILDAKNATALQKIVGELELKPLHSQNYSRTTNLLHDLQALKGLIQSGMKFV